jgi:hypothetical protein
MTCCKIFQAFFTSLCLCLFLASFAFAVPSTFFGEDEGLGEAIPLPSWPNAAAAEANFLTNLVGGIGTEDFEGFLPGTMAPLPVVFPGSGVTATLNGNGIVASVPEGTTNGVGRYPVSGVNFWDSNDAFSITFSEPVAAFGFYGIDIGDFDGQVTLTLEGGGSIELVIPHTILGLGGSVLFFGFVDTEQSYTSITMGNTAPTIDFFAFDDMTVGTSAEVLTGACCLEAFECIVLSAGECAQYGNGIDDSFYMGDGTDCATTACSVVPVEDTTWGSVKSLYR